MTERKSPPEASHGIVKYQGIRRALWGKLWGTKGEGEKFRFYFSIL